nr:quinolinate synthase NadA [Sporotomaculum syntrophicum]
MSIYTHPGRVITSGESTTIVQQNRQLAEDIKRLKKEKDVYIIAHYYQRPEVQDIADFVGDSYAMAVAAKDSPCANILVAGVDFMAESAAILCPDKTVLSPEPRATCPMANSIEVDDVLQFKQEHPDGLVVSYVNTPAGIKAVTDICVTSSNAVKIINKLPRKARIFFIPDTNLGTFVAGQLDRELDLFPSHCPTHAHITKADILQRKAEHPEAEVLVHPECDPEVVALADYVGSTAGIIDYAVKSDKNTFIIGTECGVFHKIQQLSPDKELVLAQDDLVCPNMKSINLKKILSTLETMETKITVPEATREKAALALEKMIEYAS